jgi:hypothetical protein
MFTVKIVTNRGLFWFPVMYKMCKVNKLLHIMECKLRFVGLVIMCFTGFLLTELP